MGMICVGAMATMTHRWSAPRVTPSPRPAARQPVPRQKPRPSPPSRGRQWSSTNGDPVQPRPTKADSVQPRPTQADPNFLGPCGAGSDSGRPRLTKADLYICGRLGFSVGFRIWSNQKPPPGHMVGACRRPRCWRPPSASASCIPPRLRFPE